MQEEVEEEEEEEEEGGEEEEEREMDEEGRRWASRLGLARQIRNHPVTGSLSPLA